MQNSLYAIDEGLRGRNILQWSCYCSAMYSSRSVCLIQQRSSRITLRRFQGNHGQSEGRTLFIRRNSSLLFFSDLPRRVKLASRPNKHAVRKRAKFFQVKSAELDILHLTLQKPLMLMLGFEGHEAFHSKNKACNRNRYKRSNEAVAVFCKCRL